MNSGYIEQKNNLIFLIVISLFIFTATAAFYIYEKEKTHILENEQVKLQTEIELLGEFLSDSILRRDYAQAKNYLNSWVKKGEDIRKLEVVFENGLKLYSYKKDCNNEMFSQKSFSVGNKNYTIYLSHSVLQMNQHIGELANVLIFIVIVFTSLIGFILWFILSRWILKPLQSEIKNKTKDIHNKQQELAKINRSYQALSCCNYSLVEAKAEQELLDNICRIIYDSTRYKLVWIGYAKKNEEKSVDVMSFIGLDDGYLENVNITWDKSSRGNGPTGKSIREQIPVVVNDTLNDPYFEPWRENALERGFKSCMSVPIVYKEMVFGSINIYSEKVNAFIDEEIQLLKELASNLAFGIISLRQRQEIERCSITDGLTDIYNRRYFDKKFIEVVQGSKRNNDLVSFLIIDIDFFKQYNDNYGHQKGDEVLKDVSKTLDESTKRINDYCFRLGGEEFGVLFISKSKEDAFTYCEKIRESIFALQIEHKYSNVSKYVSASMGLVTLEATKIDSTSEMYKQADELLYLSKKSGRNKITSN